VYRILRRPARPAAAAIATIHGVRPDGAVDQALRIAGLLTDAGVPGPEVTALAIDATFSDPASRWRWLRMQG
jgi:hypothetical protein